MTLIVVENVSETDMVKISKTGFWQVTVQNVSILMDLLLENVSEIDTVKTIQTRLQIIWIADFEVRGAFAIFRNVIN